MSQEIKIEQRPSSEYGKRMEKTELQHAITALSQEWNKPKEKNLRTPPGAESKGARNYTKIKKLQAQINQLRKEQKENGKLHTDRNESAKA